MREGWQAKRLGDVATLQRGFDLPTQDRISGGFPIVSSSGISDTHYKGAVCGPGVVTGRSGSIGNIFFIEEDFWPLNTALYVKDFHGNDPKFISYLLKNFNLGRFATGSGVPTLNRNLVHDELVSIPPPHEQKRITAILDEAFEGIDTAIANAEKNLANARELFDSCLEAVFCRIAEWEEKTVGELADHTLGKMLDQRKNRGTLRPYLRNLNVRWFGFDLDDVLEMPFEDHETDRYTAIKGDVLMCEGGYPGRCAIWEHDERIYVQKAIHRIRFKQKSLNKWFLYFIYFLDARNRLQEHFTGSGIQHFTGQALHGLRVPLPPTVDLKTYVDRFDAYRSRGQKLEAVYSRKLGHLIDLKRAVLQKAFAGELTPHSVEVAREAAE